MISASALSRLLSCPGSAAIPQARTNSVYAEQGAANHAAREEATHAGDHSDLPAEIREALAGYDEIRPEVAVAYDVATGVGRELGVSIGRRYTGLAPFEIPGTMDLLALDAGRTRALIVDYKLFVDADWIQLQFYALAVARAHRLTEVTVVFAYLGDGRERTVWRTLDAFELDVFAGVLTDLHPRVAVEQAKVAQGLIPDVNEGSYCKHCPARHACPARVALARRVLGGDEMNAMAVLRPLDDAMAAQLYGDIKRARSVLDQLAKAIYARAAEAPIPLGGGRMLGRHATKGNERLSGDMVYRVVTERMGRDTADLVVERTATKKALHDVVRDVKVEREILDEVRRRGGATRPDKDEICEYQLALPADDEAA